MVKSQHASEKNKASEALEFPGPFKVSVREELRLSILGLVNAAVHSDTVHRGRNAGPPRGSPAGIWGLPLPSGVALVTGPTCGYLRSSSSRRPHSWPCAVNCTTTVAFPRHRKPKLGQLPELGHTRAYGTDAGRLTASALFLLQTSDIEACGSVFRRCLVASFGQLF